MDANSHLMNIKCRHDQNISLWQKNGAEIKLVKYWELERYTRLKQQEVPFFNQEQVKSMVAFLLRDEGLSFDDIIEIWNCFPQKISKQFPNHYNQHILSHLFGTLLSDTVLFQSEKILTLAVDAGPDSINDDGIFSQCYYCGCLSEYGKIKDIFSISSPGFLWNTLANKLNMREGTIMALASASTSAMYADFTPIPKIFNNKNYWQIERYVDTIIQFASSLKESDSPEKFNGFDPAFSEYENRVSMVAKIIQNNSIKIMEQNIDFAISHYDIHPNAYCLAITGGYTLNCPTNSYLMNKYGFKKFHAVPCPNDGGLSMGIALSSFYAYNPTFHFRLKSAYYGSCDLSEKYKEHFKNNISSICPADMDTIITDIIRGPILWFYGNAEIGPRALGNRSILADPRTEKSKEQLNIIKQRQWWRPVAPIILKEDVSDWFENAYDSPYMLHTFLVKPDRRKLVPAILHLDNSARVQTLGREDNKILYDLILQFKYRTGIPLICNTSANDLGEPIIQTIEEAFLFALKKRLSVIYINMNRVCLKNHEKVPIGSPSLSFYMYENCDQKAFLLQQENPFGFSRKEIELYAKHKFYFDSLDIKKYSDAKKIKRIIHKISKLYYKEN